jgi:hypothetical protein
MNKERKLIIAGNWKMNKTAAEGLDLVRGLKIELGNVKEVDIVVCPPFTALSEVSKAILDSNLRLGAQTMSEHNGGAYTGELAAGTNAVAQAVVEATQKNGAKSIIGGGDSVKAINQAKLGDQVTFMSTGGGASLEFLEGAVLPGVAALSDK